MKRLLLILALLCSALTASAETVTYTIDGVTETNYPKPGAVTCDLTITASGDATGSVHTMWDFISANRAGLSLPGGITLSFGTDKTGRGMYVQGVLKIEGATETGGYIRLTHATKYIYHVVLKDTYGKVLYDSGSRTKVFGCCFDQASIASIVVSYGNNIPIAGAIIDGIEEAYLWDNAPIKPEPKIVCYGMELTKDEHYTVSYENNNQLGTATARITGISPYSGTVTVNYMITNSTFATVWESGNTYTVTKNETIATLVTVTGTGYVILRIAEGATLNATQGIDIINGATLIIYGPGTLKVKGPQGNYGNKGSAASNNGDSGGTGGAGIMGNAGKVQVNGAMVSIEGGKGGKGGDSHYGLTPNYVRQRRVFMAGDQQADLAGGDSRFWGRGGDGGDGGVGISGSLTVNGGMVTVRGGMGGTFGLGDPNGDEGNRGRNISGKVICTATGAVIQESDDYTTWNALPSGSTSTKGFLRVVASSPLALYDKTDNTSAIAEVTGDEQLYSVTLSGRTLFKDGSWNTLCLPFYMNAADVTTQLAPEKLMTLSATDFSGGTLTMIFQEATKIDAGKPYIIKWSGGDNIVDPVFMGVSITNTTASVVTDYVAFRGTYGYQQFTEEDKSILFLGANNTLYYPVSGARIDAFRAYFQLKGIQAGDVAETKMWFGDEDQPLSISPEGEGTKAFPREGLDGVIYNISGQRISKPQKGINIINGKKVMY